MSSLVLLVSSSLAVLESRDEMGWGEVHRGHQVAVRLNQGQYIGGGKGGQYIGGGKGGQYIGGGKVVDITFCPWLAKIWLICLLYRGSPRYRVPQDEFRI